MSAGSRDPADAPTPPMAGALGSQRIDKWLWHARIFKTRSLSATFAASGKLRVNGTRVAKPSQSVSAGDVLTFPLRDNVRVLRIAGLAARRGPFAEAQRLYEDISPPPLPRPERPTRAPAPPQGQGRPTKKDRRDMDRFTDRGDGA